jgi:hypothetical protein
LKFPQFTGVVGPTFTKALKFPQLAGVVGPTVGGLLYSYNPFAPVLAVCLGYVAMSVAVSWAFPRYVVPALKANAASKEKAE